MHCRVLNHGGAYLVALLLVGCAALNANLSTPVKVPLEGKRVVVFPFPDPFYRGRQIHGVGVPFSTVIVAKLQAAGVLAETSGNPLPPSGDSIDLTQACQYATEHDYDAFLTGVITEWIDGAARWSGTVDVAALSVTVYRSTTCESVGSASGRQKGQWFTLDDAPTTRFFESLSEAIVDALLNKGTLRQQ
jgi:uncharacterized protein DUF4823